MTSLVPCPVGRITHPVHPMPDGRECQCPTMLQPYRGRLTTGIAEHLIRVHAMPSGQAYGVAGWWVGKGCRATR